LVDYRAMQRVTHISKAPIQFVLVILQSLSHELHQLFNFIHGQQVLSNYPPLTRMYPINQPGGVFHPSDAASLKSNRQRKFNYNQSWEMWTRLTFLWINL